MVEIYKSEGKNPKTYLVEDIDYINMKGHSDSQKLENFISFSIRYFKVRPNRLFMTSVWILNDEMYLEDPHTRGAKRRTAICLINNKIKVHLIAFINKDKQRRKI